MTGRKHIFGIALIGASIIITLIGLSIQDLSAKEITTFSELALYNKQISFFQLGLIFWTFGLFSYIIYKDK